MATLGTLTTKDVKTTGIGGSKNGFPPNPNGGNGGGDWPPANPQKYRIAMWFIMASVLMLFMAFTSAYVIRQGLANDWQPLAIPTALWLSTVVLFFSSFTLEGAKRALHQGREAAFKQRLYLSTILGGLFLVGQIAACQQLMARGLYLGTNPHSSFFYVLTVAHALHILGGVIFLSYLVWGSRHNRFTATQSVKVDVTTLYWHFMDILWIYLFLLLFFWR